MKFKLYHHCLKAEGCVVVVASSELSSDRILSNSWEYGLLFVNLKKKKKKKNPVNELLWFMLMNDPP